MLYCHEWPFVSLFEVFFEHLGKNIIMQKWWHEIFDYNKFKSYSRSSKFMTKALDRRVPETRHLSLNHFSLRCMAMSVSLLIRNINQFLFSLNSFQYESCLKKFFRSYRVEVMFYLARAYYKAGRLEDCKRLLLKVCHCHL